MPLAPLPLLQQAVSIPSPSGHEHEVAEFLVSQLATFASDAFVDDAGNAVGQVGTGPLQVTFLGHIDTVAGNVPVRVEDGKLYGRGSVDAKGAFCTAVAAASTLSEEAKSRITLRLIGAVEEEAPSSKGARFAVDAYPKPDLLIIGEPSSWDAITLGYKGRLVVKLEHHKANFHSAGDDTTAAEDVINAWQAIQTRIAEFNQDTKGIFDAIQVSLQSIQSDNDGLNQSCHATIGFRLPLAHPPEAMEAVIAPMLEPFTTTISGREHAHRATKDNPLSRAFRVAIREHGGKPRFKVKTGTSDMNVVAPYWNVPMLAYGPGDSSLDHTPNEHVGISELERAVTVLSHVLHQLG
ncbi:MAG: [LysW]-lysine hydrolase [Deinococcota bacterium]